MNVVVVPPPLDAWMFGYDTDRTVPESARYPPTGAVPIFRNRLSVLELSSVAVRSLSFRECTVVAFLSHVLALNPVPLTLRESQPCSI